MNKSRQQFDRYFSDKHDLTMKHFGDPVIKFTMDRLFEVWQASRKSLEVELPERKNYSGFQQFDNGYERAIDDCENILISNGVKVK